MFVNSFIEIYLATFLMLFAIGPICLTVINYNILKGFKIGLIAGAGVVAADICYIIAGSFFLDIVRDFLSNFYLKIFSVFMAFFLFYISYTFFNKKIENVNKIEKDEKKISIFVKLFLLTISGPTTIFTYLAIFSGFSGKNFDTRMMIISASLATMSFYLILNIVLFFIRQKLSEKAILSLNKISSLIIFIFGLTIIYKNLLSN